MPLRSLSRRTILASVAAFACLPKCVAADIDELELLMKQGRYLPLLHLYQNQTSTSGQWLAAQLAAMTGDEDAAFDIPSAMPVPVPDLSGCRALDAVQTIVQAARTRQIVILNEAHHAARCRGFAGIIAAHLAAEGFSIFAAEAFDNSKRPSAAAAALNAGGAVTPELGWYLADPAFAETVRAARRHGYHFAGYEARAGQIEGTSGAGEIVAREDGEANNFIADILDHNPKARIFVLCGYDHVMKTVGPDGKMWFAARLKAKTGIDPLCISQSWGLPVTTGEDPALKAVLTTFSPTAPVILFDRQDRPFNPSMGGTVDAEVIHPRLSPVDGRPGWLAALPGRKRAAFTLTALPGAHDLIQAIPASDVAIANAIPADQYPLPLGAKEAVFYLPRGDYEIRLESDDGRSVMGHLKV